MKTIQANIQLEKLLYEYFSNSIEDVETSKAIGTVMKTLQKDFVDMLKGAR